MPRRSMCWLPCINTVKAWRPTRLRRPNGLRQWPRRGGRAQLLLADCYLRGRGVPEDYVLAYVWFNHAAAQGLDLASKYKRLTERCMTPDQIASAQEKTRIMAAA